MPVMCPFVIYEGGQSRENPIKKCPEYGVYYGLYCHRKFEPHSKPSLCYNNNLMERSIRWKPNESEKDSHPSLKRRSFWKHSTVKVHKRSCVKEEEVYLNDYEDIHEVRARIGHFIEQVYHQKRPHSALGYLTPMEFEQQTLS